MGTIVITLLNQYFKNHGTPDQQLLNFWLSMGEHNINPVHNYILETKCIEVFGTPNKWVD